MIITLSLLAAGFLLGIRHSFEADHVAAVSTMAGNSKNIKESSVLGAFWGFGHTMMLILTTLFVAIFKTTISTSFSLMAEIAVGLMLILLGMLSIVKLLKGYHSHVHQHDGRMHMHYHSHDKETPNHVHEHSKLKSKTFFIGTIHGLAGSGALIVLLGAASNSVVQSLAYAAVFGFGSVIGMLVSSSAIALPFMLAKSFEKIHYILVTATSLFSITIGIVHIYAI